MFLSIFEIIQVGIESLSALDILIMFVLESGGGILLGLGLGYVAYRAMKTIDNYKVEVMITLAVMMGGYMVAEKLHISGHPWPW